jgi:hypothetical protein
LQIEKQEAFASFLFGFDFFEKAKNTGENYMEVMDKTTLITKELHDLISISVSSGVSMLFSKE